MTPFHWRNHIWQVKTKFLDEIIKIEEWKSILVVISNKNYSYQLFENLLSKALQGLYIRKMYIDGKKHKDYVSKVKKSLKNVGIKINELKMVRHQAKGGLRLSDAVAGLARLHYDHKAKGESAMYFKRFLNKKITAQVMSGY